jgi:uncharacterized phage protein gp47/JayE
MAFIRPTLVELVDRTTASIRSRLALGPLLARSFLGVLGRALAGLAHGLHGHISYGADQAIPLTASTDALERAADLYGLDPVRRPASPAVGVTRFTGTTGTSIPVGTIVSRPDGERYATDAGATIAAGIADVALTALVAGLSSNADPATILSLASPIAGIDNDSTVDASGMTLGADLETDEQLRARLKVFARARPQGGSTADYPIWALEVAGVTRVFVLPANSGLGTVDVTFTVDDDPAGPIPSVAQVAAVQARLTDVTRRDSAPLGALVTTFAPVAAPVSFTLSVLPNSIAVQAAVKAALEDLVLRDAVPAGTITLHRMNEAISTAAGETDHTLTVPAADFVAAAGELPTFNSVTFV